MSGYSRAVIAEILKYRRTPAVWLTFGIPVLIIGLALVILTQSNLADADDERKWGFLQGMTAQMWTTMCLPIGGAILIGMLWGLEHGSNQLKHVLAQPPSRHATFWAKTTGIFTLIAVGTVFLGVLTALLAVLLGIGPVRWEIAFEMPLRAYLASLPALALVSWVAQRYASFALPLILGVAGIVIGGIAAQSDYWPYVPWAWALTASVGSEESARDTALMLGLGGGVLVFVMSWSHFHRADAPS